MVLFRNALAVLLKCFEIADQGLFGILDGLLVGATPSMASRKCREEGKIAALFRMGFYGERVGERFRHHDASTITRLDILCHRQPIHGQPIAAERWTLLSLPSAARNTSRFLCRT